MLLLSRFTILDATVSHIYHQLIFLAKEFYEFVCHERMSHITQRVFWIHIEVPGQGDNDPDLPKE